MISNGIYNINIRIYEIITYLNFYHIKILYNIYQKHVLWFVNNMYMQQVKKKKKIKSLILKYYN